MVFVFIYGSDNSADDLAKRSNQPVEIVRPLTEEECDPDCQPMYRVRALDGHEFDAFAEELGL